MKFKSTKVLATAVAVTIIATGVAGCNRDGGAGSSASGTVVFAVSTQTNPFFVQLVDGAKKEAKAKGVTFRCRTRQTTPPPRPTSLLTRYLPQPK